ncbi:hypothetical protein EVAR_72285_1 [Eumeta japonica]|uniref:Uncharacterized protein n=1 Tax=Eumeta variegata TaxID=151549 RepID=A0A4C1T834_EUMVA|nr:hypothetical protein EVAR_72285_1 [Eumeta japonica]
MLPAVQAAPVAINNQQLLITNRQHMVMLQRQPIMVGELVMLKPHKQHTNSRPHTEHTLLRRKLLHNLNGTPLRMQHPKLVGVKMDMLHRQLPYPLLLLPFQ